MKTTTPTLVGTFILFQSLFAASTIQFQSRTLTVAETSGQVALPVVRLNDSETEVAVEFYSVQATATAGQDFTAVSGTLSFAAGVTNQTINVPILNDALVESLERFQVVLTNATGGAVLGSMKLAAVSIQDNDTGIHVFGKRHWVREDAGGVTLSVTRGPDECDPAVLDYLVLPGSATPDQDYVSGSGQVVLVQGQRNSEITVPILNDGLGELDEAFSVRLTNLVGGVLTDPKEAIIIICDNDPGLGFRWNVNPVFESDGVARLEVVRGQDADLGPMSVAFRAEDLTATQGVDYTGASGQLEFQAGELSVLLEVPILWDQDTETNETFEVVLLPPDPHTFMGMYPRTTVEIWDTAGSPSPESEGIRIQADGTVELSFSYTAPSMFSNHFVVYPLEVSDDLWTWTPLTPLEAVAGTGPAPTGLEPVGAGQTTRFYRTSSTPLLMSDPSPTGRFLVGVEHRQLTDHARPERRLTWRECTFKVSVYYPATPEAGCWPGLTMAPALVHNQYVSSRLALLSRTYSRGLVGAPCDPTGAPYPVVLYSHGYYLGHDFCSSMANELASHGYVVLVPVHYDAWLSVLPDGRLVRGPGEAMTLAGLSDRVADLRFLVETLESWNETDPQLRGQLDLERLAVIGMSWGGCTAVEFCDLESSCRAAVLLDAGGETGSAWARGLAKPVMAAGAGAMFDRAKSDAINFSLQGASHCDYSGRVFDLYDGEYRPPDTYWEYQRTLKAYTVSFLNHYVKDLDDTCHQASPSPDYPLIEGYRKK